LSEKYIMSTERKNTMSIQTIMKKKQNRLLSKTWRTALEEREIERNNFHVTGSVRAARYFAHAAKTYQPPMVVQEVEPTIIYSSS
jgi:hypothetical protein